MDRQDLADRLQDRYEPDPATLRAVSRQARDLADSGRIEEDFGYTLTAEDVLANLEDAPEDHSFVERWNWWIDSLETAKGGYDRFRVRPDIA